MGRKDGFGRFELFRFSPSSATLPPHFNLSSTSWHHCLFLPTLSGGARERALQLQGRSPLGWILLPFSSISSTLGPPPILSPRQTLLVSPPTFWNLPSPRFSNSLQTIRDYYWNCFTTASNPPSTSLRNYPDSYLNCFSFHVGPPPVFKSFTLLPKKSSFNYLPLPFNSTI